jgi:tripartite-type tricarboxylate transporter receptor subunit TctC
MGSGFLSGWCGRILASGNGFCTCGTTGTTTGRHRKGNRILSRITFARRSLLLAAPALLPLVRAASAQAPGWRPARPVRLVVPFAPGGFTDILAREMADRLAPPLGQPVLVENRAGAGGNIAAEAVVRAAPDGLTLLVATQGIVEISKALFSQLSYDPDADLVPLGMLAAQPNLLVVGRSRFPDQDLAQVLAAAKTRNGGLSYGSNGAGSFTHLSMELLRSLAGVPMVHVPYRGSAPMLTDLMAGHIDLAFDGLGTSLPQVTDGGLRAVAVSSARPAAVLPAVPPVAATVPGFDATPWYGVFAATSVPQPVRQALEAVLQGVLASPAWAQLLRDRQAEPLPGGSAELATMIAREREVWRDVVRKTGTRAD